MINLNKDFNIREAVALSLYTDRDRWFGEDLSEIFGSFLYLLGREKATLENAELARGYAEEALQWLIADGIATNINVVSVLVDKQMIKLRIKIDLDKTNDIYEEDFFL